MTLALALAVPLVASTTRTFEPLAQKGIRYNNFHTTALFSPTRAAQKLQLPQLAHQPGVALRSLVHGPGL